MSKAIPFKVEAHLRPREGITEDQVMVALAPLLVKQWGRGHQCEVILNADALDIYLRVNGADADYERYALLAACAKLAPLLDGPSHMMGTYLAGKNRDPWPCFIGNTEDERHEARIEYAIEHIRPAILPVLGVAAMRELSEHIRTMRMGPPSDAARAASDNQDDEGQTGPSP